MLLSICQNRRTAAKASHSVGKTILAALAANWWYDCWPEHIVYITAPTWDRAQGITFKNIVRIRRARGLEARGEIMEKIVRDWDKYHRGAHFIQVINAEKGEGIQGEHAADVLIIMEEAVGIPLYIWQAADGLLTASGCRLLAIANPTDKSSVFGQECQKRSYNVITISGLTHPNVIVGLEAEREGIALDDSDLPFPGAVTLSWIWEMIDRECDPIDSMMDDAFEFPPGSGKFWLPNASFQGRVLGLFPSMADTQVIAESWLRDTPPQPLNPLDLGIGVDVAWMGADPTGLAARSGTCIIHMEECRRYDPDVVADAAADLADELGELFATPSFYIPIRVDTTGGLGAGPVVTLQKRGYNAIGVNSARNAIDRVNYPNKRSELWFVTREIARRKELDLSRLPPDIRAKLEQELITPRWSPNNSGQKAVEGKTDIKARLGGESPNLADAVNLTLDNTQNDWSSLEQNESIKRLADEIEGRGAIPSESRSILW